MKPKGNRKSKRTKLSLKYNIQKRVREKHRRMKKEAKKMGLKKKVKKDPGIPNSWPFKAEMLQDLQRQKEERDNEMAKKRADVKQKVKSEQKKKVQEAKRSAQEAAEERRLKRAAAVEKSQHDVLRTTLARADVLLEVLDARDPMGCRCAALETWAHENGKRVVFVITKADLISPQMATRWLKALGQAGPTIVVQAEAGRDGVMELLALLGQAPEARGSEGASPSGVPCKAVGVVGYPGTGKQALCKALRREARGLIPWLLEPVARLRPKAASEPSAEAALHRIVRSTAKNGGLGEIGAEPQAVLRHLLSRVAPAQLARRFRLQAFETLEQLCDVFAQDRGLKTKRGNKPSAEAVSRKVLAELTQPPGCTCAPSEAPLVAALWAAHGEAKGLRAIMEAQYSSLGARAEGSAGTCLAIGSSATPCGPPVDLAAVLAGGEDDVDDEDEDDMDDELDDEGEGEEEEEGEESEEEAEGMSDDE